MIEILSDILDFSETAMMTLFLVFVRVGGIMALMPGFGETFIPTRIRLAITVCISVITWPLLKTGLAEQAWAPLTVVGFIVAEAASGLLIGTAFRLMTAALQVAGSIAAQSTSLAQIAGAGVVPDPMPAIGNVLLMSGLALAMAMDLHLHVVGAVIYSYEVIPFGGFVSGEVLADWGLSRITAAFNLAFSLAAPFVIAAFVYNISLGAMNKAMPQLMVAFIGAPAITGGSLLLLLLAAPAIFSVWLGAFASVLENPFEVPR